MKGNVLGSKVKKLRYNLNLTQKQLGEKSDLHYSYIGQVERGEKTPSLKALMKIADVLNISIEDLLKEDDITEEGLSSLKLKSINELLENRNPEELDLIYNFLQELLKLLDLNEQKEQGS